MNDDIETPFDEPVETEPVEKPKKRKTKAKAKAKPEIRPFQSKRSHRKFGLGR